MFFLSLKIIQKIKEQRLEICLIYIPNINSVAPNSDQPGTEFLELNGLHRPTWTYLKNEHVDCTMGLRGDSKAGFPECHQGELIKTSYIQEIVRSETPLGRMPFIDGVKLSAMKNNKRSRSLGGMA